MQLLVRTLKGLTTISWSCIFFQPLFIKHAIAECNIKQQFVTVELSVCLPYRVQDLVTSQNKMSQVGAVGDEKQRQMEGKVGKNMRSGFIWHV